jgi:hypothetical protein
MYHKIPIIIPQKIKYNKTIIIYHVFEDDKYYHYHNTYVIFMVMITFTQIQQKKKYITLIAL